MRVFQVLSLLLWIYCGRIFAEICPLDWHRYGESCYFIITDMMDWYQANRTCVESRGNLAVPNSQSEQDYIWELFLNEFDQKPDTSLWFGCNDIEEEGNWQHCPLKGENNGYENWAIGEPNNIPESDCVKMWYTRNGLWDDTQCSREDEYAVCEQHVKTPSVPTTLPDINGRLTPQCLLHHAMRELMGNGVVSCGKSCRSHPLCYSFNLLELDCPPSNNTS
ncbi:perlucin-like protein [Asterias amurensis]|uniref:perlucin-like protein n=1 Tax=Asterias amurensis TaxID=7602 RepID=UPI003AB23A4D